jgi:probable phosphoglycerate mutase
MDKIYLIRHGQSQSNAGKPTTDPVSVQLTQRGHDEARCVADFLKMHAHPLHILLTSPYRRARQTAEYTQKLFPDLLLLVWEVQEFTYLSSMHEELSTTAERRPRVEAYWKQLDPFYQDNGPKSESFASFIQRARAFIQRLKKRYPGGAVAVFSHEQFILAVRWLLESERPAKMSGETMLDFLNYFQGNRIPNGAIVCLTHNQEQLSRPDGPDTGKTLAGGWSSELITKHLQSLPGKRDTQVLPSNSH